MSVRARTLSLRIYYEARDGHRSHVFEQPSDRRRRLRVSQISHPIAGSHVPLLTFYHVRLSNLIAVF